MSANEHRAFFKKYEKYLKSAESRVHCFIQKDAFNLKSHIFEFIFEITKKTEKCPKTDQSNTSSPAKRMSREITDGMWQFRFVKKFLKDFFLIYFFFENSFEKRREMNNCLNGEM